MRKDEKTAVSLVHQAVDAGINFFDNCWEYHRGKTEDWMGKGLKGRRDKVFLMTKVCTHGREADLAMRMLEQSLNRLQTDHLDLWQIHGVSFDNDPELFIRPNGAAEASAQGERAGQSALRRFHRSQGSGDSPGDAEHGISLRFGADAAERFRPPLPQLRNDGACRS